MVDVFLNPGVSLWLQKCCCINAYLCIRIHLFDPLTFSLNIGLNMLPSRLFKVMFRFSTRILYRRVPVFATDCPYSVWCPGLTTCLLYADPLFGNLVQNDSGLLSFTEWRTTSHCLMMFLHIPYCLTYHNIVPHFPFTFTIFMSQIVLYLLPSTLDLWTLYILLRIKYAYMYHHSRYYDT